MNKTHKIKIETGTNADGEGYISVKSNSSDLIATLGLLEYAKMDFIERSDFHSDRSFN